MNGFIHSNLVIICIFIFNNFLSSVDIFNRYKRRTPTLRNYRIISGGKFSLQRPENQFMVALAFHTTKCKIKSDQFDQACQFSCTGSIISSQWVISASHCLGKRENIDAIRKRRHRKCRKCNHSKCFSKLNGRTHLIKGILCKISRHGDLEIYPKRLKSYIFVKVTDFEKEYNDLTHYEIKKLVIPREAYRGGGYKVLKLCNIGYFTVGYRL